MGTTLELARAGGDGAAARSAVVSTGARGEPPMPDQPQIPRDGTVRGLRVAFAGGGTGGHVVPGRHLLAHVSGELGDVLWFCTGRAVEQRAFEGLEIDARRTPLERVALRLEPEGGGAPSLAGLLLRTAPELARARAALRRHRSQVVVGLGGFTSLPVVLAARTLGVPVALLEINAAPGRATRWLRPFSGRVFHAWRATLPGGETARERWTGPPLAPAYSRGRASDEERARAKRQLGFDAGRPLLVVLGGSQGAAPLNRFVANEIDELTRHGLQVLHQTGPGRLAEGAAERDGYRRLEFVSDVHLALTAATLVLCRGGASTLAEVAAARRPAWIVPYPHHPDRHQERNARELGFGVALVDEGRLNAAFARELVQRTLPSAAAELEERARALERSLPLDAARRIWAELAALAQTAPRGEDGRPQVNESRA